MQTKIKQDILDKINSKTWFHSIKISEDIITPGQIKYSVLQQVTNLLQIPEKLDGLTVLDIGGWDGFLSFEAERRGAKKVVIYDLPDPDTTGFN